MKPILEIQGLSKKYRISHQAGGYLSLREKVLSTMRFEKKHRQEDFWALQDVSFTVHPGESIGIIGRNGAGKSTLLKVLSKITPPTNGRIISRGRIASLLEVGTGFHPELTGRENVFFNGSLLGMKRKEIESKFDEIVDFSGIEKFLDTPLKHYSSGMQLRLAFAVAAFLEPEILIIDEVLAVGDAEFQKKCIGKMEDVSKSGRTILFVSHNMTAVQNLCKRAILLRNGLIENIGDSHEIIVQHLQMSNQKKSIEPNVTKETYIAGITISSDNESVFTFKTTSFTVNIVSKTERLNVFIGVGINDLMGNRIFTLFSKHINQSFKLHVGENNIKTTVGSLPLKPGMYTVEIYVGDGVNEFDYYRGGYLFEVIAPRELEFNLLPDESQGSIIVNQVWS